MEGRQSRRQVLITAGASVAGVAGIAGCSGTGDQSTESSGGDQTEADSTQQGTTVGNSASSGPTTIQWWHAMGGARGETLSSLVDEFNNQSDGVEVTTSYKGGYYENINATISAIQAGNPPAITQVLNVASKLAFDSGAFEPAEAIVGDRINWDRFYDPVVGYYTWEDTVQAVPFNESNPLLYYNKDAFEAAGLDPESPPRTYTEIEQAAQTLMDEGVTDSGLVFKNTSWYPEQWFAEQNQVLVNNGNGREGDADEIFLTSDAGLRTYRWLVDMHENDRLLIAGGGEGGGANNAPIQVFLNQQAGMLIQTTGDAVSTVRAASENGFEAGTGFFPVPEGMGTGVVMGGAGLWVPREIQSERKTAAAEFLSWLTTNGPQMQWHKGTGYFPATEDATDQLQSDDWFSENPHLQTGFEQLRQTEITPATKGFQVGPSSEIRGLMQDAFIEMLNSGQSVEAILGDATEEGNAILQDYTESKQ